MSYVNNLLINTVSLITRSVSMDPKDSVTTKLTCIMKTFFIYIQKEWYKLDEILHNHGPIKMLTVQLITLFSIHVE